VDVYGWYLFVGAHVDPEILKRNSAHFLFFVVIVMLFVLFPAVLLHQYIDDLIQLDVGLYGEVDEFLIGVVEVECGEEIVEEGAVGYLGLVSEFVSMVFIVLGQDGLVQRFDHILFGVLSVGESEKSFDCIEDVIADLVDSFLLAKFFFELVQEIDGLFGGYM